MSRPIPAALGRLGAKVRSKVTARPLAVTLAHLGRPSLGPYYVTLAGKPVEHPRVDAFGGVLAVDRRTGATYLHPVTNTHLAYIWHARHLEAGDDESRARFLGVLEALAQSGQPGAGGALVWPYPVVAFRGHRVPWLSAMAQGQVVGVACRGFELTGDERWLDLARRAFVPFERPIAEGGVCSDDTRLGVFYEEYAYFEREAQRHTLNGMASALFGLYDLAKIAGDAAPRAAFDQGAATIRANLPRYDFPFCSAYDLRHVVSGAAPLFNPHYNSVHVAHLHILAGMTGDAYFDGVADAWSGKLEDPVNRARMGAWYVAWKLGDWAGRARERLGRG